MQHTRVLGTIALLGAAVLGAIGPSGASQAAPASKSGSQKQHNTQKVPVATAKARLQQALRVGYAVTANGKHIPLSSALVNAFGHSAHVSKSSGSASAGHVDSRASGFMQVSPAARANQDFGYYQTGNGQLFHNTESVAVDPGFPLHVVVSATDTRDGSDSSNFNFSSNPLVNGILCLTGAPGAITPLTCPLIQALGGPGVYNSVDGAASFTDLIVPDMISGAVPNEIDPFINPQPAPSGDGSFFSGDITCISPSGFVGNQLNVPGQPNDCLPYDSAGDQSVAFDNAGNLYDASLGLVSYNPLVGAGPFGLTGLPQTDVVVNVSPAVQPVGAVPGAAGAPVITSRPDAAGRFFNALPFQVGAAGAVVCDPTLPSTTVCLHGEVTASNSSSNFIAPNFSGVSEGAGVVGRNWQADALTANADSGPGFCGIVDVCLIDQPYLAINTATDPQAILTYTLIDFSLIFGAASNIYLQTSTIPAAVGTGTLPVWSGPVLVDNPATNAQNLYCAATTSHPGGCFDSWGAEPTAGPDGAFYIAYENGDLNLGYNTSTTDITGLNSQFDSVILVAFFGVGATNVSGTAFAAEVLDHDAYNLFVAGVNPFGDPAGLDPASGAYFTIPNRPTIAVTGPITNLAGKNYPAGVVIVAWTDQRSLTATAAGGPPASPIAASVTRGTRVWYTLCATKSSQPLNCSVLGPGTGGLLSPNAITIASPAGATTETGYGVAPGTGTPTIGPAGPLYWQAEVYEPNTTVNQFFPWLAASQESIANPNIADNIFIGFYQETPGTVTYANSDNTETSTASMTFYAGKSSNYGSSFGVTPAGTAMPLPNPPVSLAYCAAAYGFTYTGAGALFTSKTDADAACNGVPYFGTYTGAAWDRSNGAYLSWTDTRPNVRNFNVGGSQDVFVANVQ